MRTSQARAHSFTRAESSGVHTTTVRDLSLPTLSDNLTRYFI
jgi:hypothetical protein